jgi:hypothetical protein
LFRISIFGFFGSIIHKTGGTDGTKKDNTSRYSGNEEGGKEDQHAHCL